MKWTISVAESRKIFFFTIDVFLQEIKDRGLISRDCNGTNLNIDGIVRASRRFLVDFTDGEFTLSIVFLRFVNVFEDEITDDASEYHETNTGTWGVETCSPIIQENNRSPTDRYEQIDNVESSTGAGDRHDETQAIDLRQDAIVNAIDAGLRSGSTQNLLVD